MTTTSLKTPTALDDTEVAASAANPAKVGWSKIDLYIGLALMGVAMVISLITMVRAAEYSRYDEYTHADYAWQLAIGEVPAAGDQLTEPQLMDWACRGDTKSTPPKCGSLKALDPNNFVYDAYNYNFFHPPLYYFVVGHSADAVSSITGLAFVTSARLVSAVISAVGIAAAYFAIRSWRVNRSLAATMTTMLLTTPMVGHLAAIVNPDALAMLIGAGAVWAAARVYVDRKVPILSVALLMFVAAASKIIIAMPLVALLFVIGVHGAWRFARSNGERAERAFALRMMLMAVISAVVLVAVYFGWDAFQAGRGDPDYVNPMTGASTREFEGRNPLGAWVGSSLFIMFGIGDDYFTHFQINGWGTELTAHAFALATAVAPLFALAVLKRGDRRLAAVVVLLAGMVLVPLVVQVQAYLDQGMYFPRMTTRYAIGLLPVNLLVLAFVIENRGWHRWVRWVVLGLGLLYLGSVVGIVR